LKQVMSNLINNAIKFTSEGGSIGVDVALLEEDDSSQTIKFSVKDDGIGISKKRQNKIFEAFRKEDDSTTRKFGGTGLGLSISSSLVTLMGGEISLQSKKNEGSDFSFTLNFQKAQNKNFTLKNLLNESRVRVVYDENDSQDVIDYLKRFNVDARLLQDSENSKEESQVIILFDEEEAQSLYNSLSDGDYLVLCFQKDSKSVSSCLNLKIVNSYKECSTQLYGALHSHFKLKNAMTEELSSFNSKKALVAEDNEVNQILIEEVLNKFGVTSTIVPNGRKALEAAKKNRYDLILMDVNMPIMNGLVATRMILEDSMNVNTPIVALTSNVLQSDVVEYKTLGMRSHLGKPFHSNDVYVLLTELFDANVKQTQTNSQTQYDEDVDENLKKAASLLELPTNVINKLFDKFLITLQTITKEMQIHYNEKDHEALMAKAHQLRGASGALCFDRISQISHEMEKSIKEGNKTDHKKSVDELIKLSKSLKNHERGKRYAK